MDLFASMFSFSEISTFYALSSVVMTLFMDSGRDKFLKKYWPLKGCQPLICAIYLKTKIFISISYFKVLRKDMSCISLHRCPDIHNLMGHNSFHNGSLCSFQIYLWKFWPLLGFGLYHRQTMSKSFSVDWPLMLKKKTYTIHQRFALMRFSIFV